MLDESEFLGPFGIRAISRYHADHPYVFDIAGQEFRVDYEPAESSTGMFGGNSNWRGPVWFPMNMVIVRGLRQLHAYYGDNLKVECPTGSGNELNLLEVADEIGRRLASIFMRDEDGRRPVFGGIEPFQSDPHWRDLLEFHEYFHGDNGAGLGASHQTGWTGLVAMLPGLTADLGRRGSAWPGRPPSRAPSRSPHHLRDQHRRLAGGSRRQLNHAVDLSTVPAPEWDRLAALRVDAVWLMGVWQRSPAGLAIARRQLPADGELQPDAARPASPMMSSARRTASATTRSTRASAGRRRSRRHEQSSPREGSA